MMKNALLFFVSVIILVNTFDLCLAQDVLNDRLYTLNTGASDRGKWVRIATCTNVGFYQDHGTIFELFGNGSSNDTFFYGKLIARFKRQSSEAGPATSMALILYDSNIGSENIVGIRNGATIDVYLRINMSYTRFYYTGILTGSSAITALKEDSFITDLPLGDYTIQCIDGSVSFSNIKASSMIINGAIEVKEVKVSSAPGADFIFDKDYSLPELCQLEAFIHENRHLPNIPSAKEMETSGVDSVEMNKLLLQKIEELTLYVINQHKTLEAQQTTINQMQEKLSE